MAIFETVNSSKKYCVNRDILEEHLTIQIEYIHAKFAFLQVLATVLVPFKIVGLPRFPNQPMRSKQL